MTTPPDDPDRARAVEVYYGDRAHAVSQTGLVVRIVSKNRNGEEILVAAKTYQDAKYFDVRIFVRGDDGTVIPTAKGVTVGPKLVEAVIRAMVEAARESDWLPPGGRP